MAQPFIGEIRMFAGNFAPRNWALAAGQLLPISQFSALFSLYGTTYGGDGRTTFGLPDMRSRIPIHQGRGPGLNDRRIGSRSGAEQVTLSTSQLPSHSHGMNASTDIAQVTNPAITVVARSPTVSHWIDEAPTSALNFQAITQVGATTSHPNMAPFQCLNFIVALVGTFPSRAAPPRDPLIASGDSPAGGVSRG
jgi:microcystin-dependent protein